MRVIFARALGLPDNGLDAVIDAGNRPNTLGGRLDAIQAVSGNVNVPSFSGREDEDVEQWIMKFEAAFTASGRAAGNNGVNKAALAITFFKDNAMDWYQERKNAGAGNLVNWVDADNDNDLKHRMKQKFITDDIRNKKMDELHRIRQNVGETVEEYARRFRKTLRIATRNNALGPISQVNFFINGLKTELIR